jgi:small-conductance mechanosensitive channel
MELFRLVGPNQAVEILGVKLVGVNAENGRKLLFSLAFIAIVFLLGRGLHWLARRGLLGSRHERIQFWTRQAIRVAMTVVLVVGLASIWFDDPTRLATGLGLVTAGLALALQKVVTAVAGYLVILRGGTFNVGDRIVMGGVRGDVIALGFTQTTIMEMGQPPAVQNADPAMWVRSRQYTGRVVSVSNARIFDEPVYNYTRDLPYLWEEFALPISYRADRARLRSQGLPAHHGRRAGGGRVARGQPGASGWRAEAPRARRHRQE